MFENVCSYPLSSDLFAQAIHPTEPIIATGLATGHVQNLRLPPLTASSSQAGGTSDSVGTIETIWRTRRHKGSCRSLAFDYDGKHLFSAGSDGLVKVASTETGQVVRKFAVPAARGELLGSPALLHALSPDTLILATDTAAVHVYDLRNGAGKTNLLPQQTLHPHEDYVSSLTPLPPSESSTSGFSKQWVTTGGTTLAVSDLRKGVLVKSENQEDELLSSAIVSGLGRRGTSVGEKVVVGGAEGVLTLWERGVWDDQDERITVDAGRGGGESLDVVTTVPANVGTGREVLAGLGDGRIAMIQLGANKVVAEYRHDEMEGVLALDFDAEGRLISGGGQILKVWREGMIPDDDAHSVAESAQESDEEDVKRKRDSEPESEESDDSEGSDGADRPTPATKKHRRGADQVNDRGEHGILAFKGLG